MMERMKCPYCHTKVKFLYSNLDLQATSVQIAKTNQNINRNPSGSFQY